MPSKDLPKPQDTEPDDSADTEAHGVEVEDDTESAILNVNFGCGKG